MNIHQFIKKLQGLHEKQKIVIIFVVVGICTVILGYFWVVDAKNNVAQIGQALKSQSLPDINLQDSLNTASILPSGGQEAIQNALQDVNQSPTPTPNPMTDWKTYVNASYNYQIQYPSDLSLKENTSNPAFVSASLKDDNGYPFWISAGESKEKNVVSILNPKSSDYTEIKNETVVVNDITWKTIQETNIPQEGKGTAGSLLNFYTQQGNNTYILQCVNCNADVFGDDGVAKTSVFNQIVSTFKFTQ